jgi:hypothetical protein
MQPSNLQIGIVEPDAYQNKQLERQNSRKKHLQENSQISLGSARKNSQQHNKPH